MLTRKTSNTALACILLSSARHHVLVQTLKSNYQHIQVSGPKFKHMQIIVLRLAGQLSNRHAYQHILRRLRQIHRHWSPSVYLQGDLTALV